MDFQTAKEEYMTALSRGKKEFKELTAEGKSPHPAVLDDILDGREGDMIQDLGLVDIPTHRIVGTKSAGRITENLIQDSGIRVLSGGRKFMRDSGYLTMIPGLIIMLTVIAFNLVGDGLRDAMDPKLKR